MELKDFIKETITSIIVGVQESQSYVKGKGLECEVCPTILNRDTGLIFSNSGKPIREVEFDILVSVSKKTEKKGVFGITIKSINLGKENNNEQLHGQESRLKFSLPITLPHQT